MLTIRHYKNYIAERRYVYDVIFNTFLGIPYQIIGEERKDVRIESDDGKTIVVDDTFFQMKQADYLQDISLPDLPLAKWQVAEESVKDCFVHVVVPIIYGKAIGENHYLNCLNDKMEIGVDIFGSTFFMLTRYEEAVKKNVMSMIAFQQRIHLPIKRGF